MDWQPIKTAPKDGTKIDLWVVDKYYETVSEERITNCWWGQPTGHYGGPRHVAPKPQWCVVERDTDGDPYDETVEESEPHWSRKATHWMRVFPPSE